MAFGTGFSETQLGRFGYLMLNHFNLQISNNPDPDQQAAHLLASDGRLPNPRPTIQEILRLKGMCDYDRDPIWRSWLPDFDTIRVSHLGNMNPLTPECPSHSALSRFSGTPPECWHVLIPPLNYYNLIGFRNSELPNLSDDVNETGLGVFIPRDAQRKWIYIITLEGEIIITKEDYGIIKHVCISGGRPVWAAGDIGIKDNKIRVVNLQTGHYIRATASTRIPFISQLLTFTKEVFEKYSAHWSIQNCLHNNFECVRQI